MVNVQVFLFAPPLLQAPLQMASRPFDTFNVMLVPTVNCAEPVLPLLTFSPAGVEVTLLPLRPSTVSVSAAVPPLPQTFGVPPPPQVSGVVQVPQFNVPPQPLEMEPQFLPWAAHVVGTHPPHTLFTPPPPQVSGAVQVPQSR
jgi:hypothetical protein